MDLVILTKQYPGNKENIRNTVTFLVDSKEFDIDICYIGECGILNNGYRNVFISGDSYERVKTYIENNYNCTWRQFQDYFLYKLYKYSRGIGLTEPTYTDLSNIIKN